MTDTTHSVSDKTVTLTEIADFIPLPTVEDMLSVRSRRASEGGSSTKSIHLVSVSHPAPTENPGREP